jgi:LmbE family N-acetylglucosaminyl deacetylase
MKPHRLIAFTVFLIHVLSGVQAGNHNSYPLPEDRGTAGILAALEKLPVYVRVLQITAHPDDENAPTLTWLARKFHAQTALFSLTRGEGGQNLLGSEKYGALSIVRTGELLEACKYYGIDLYFGTAMDFGFSKTAEETLSKWGRDAELEEMVRFIRRWRPTIILSRFQGIDGDGHGHHQAAGILAREAYRAAGDPGKFPQQLRDGLHAWQPKKLYQYNFINRAGSVAIPVGDYDPVLGRSYSEIAAEGYSKHRTQGNGADFRRPGNEYECFKLIESEVGRKEQEGSLFDLIDTSLNAIFELAGNEKAAIPFLQDDLRAASEAATGALRTFQPSSPEKSAESVARGIDILTGAVRKVDASSLTAQAKAPVLDALKTKQADFQKALGAVLGIYFIASSREETEIPGGGGNEITTSFYNRGTETVFLKGVRLKAPGDANSTSKITGLEKIVPREGARSNPFTVFISKDAQPTEPFWYLDDSKSARFKIRKTPNEFAPFSDPEITAEATYIYGNTESTIQAVAEVLRKDPIRGVDFVEFQIVPALSVTLEPDFTIAPWREGTTEYKFRVSVKHNSWNKEQATLKLVSGQGWKIQPAESSFKFSSKGEISTTSFIVQVPAGTKAGNYPVEAVAVMDGQEFRRGYRVISYPENWTRNFYSFTKSAIEILDVKIAPNLNIGYVPGSGDDVPAALELLGVKIQMLSTTDLAFGDLSRFSAIVTGIRAYNVNKDLYTNNQRLLDYVRQGGTLIVQYVRPMERPAGVAVPIFPYPMSVSNSDRITVEDSPVRILDPENPIFNQPNKITESDFQGWIQERGLYFMNSWDPKYTPLLSGNDPGEESKNGGMLYAHYGDGHYIYTGYAWFRQLPAGVPGAFRIFANMLSLGEKAGH